MSRSAVYRVHCRQHPEQTRKTALLCSGAQGSRVPPACTFSEQGWLTQAGVPLLSGFAPPLQSSVTTGLSGATRGLPAQPGGWSVRGGVSLCPGLCTLRCLSAERPSLRCHGRVQIPIAPGRARALDAGATGRADTSQQPPDPALLGRGS